MQEASRLLIDTDLPIEEICHKVGYSDKGTFYGIFKAHQAPYTEGHFVPNIRKSRVFYTKSQQYM